MTEDRIATIQDVNRELPRLKGGIEVSAHRQLSDKWKLLPSHAFGVVMINIESRVKASRPQVNGQVYNNVIVKVMDDLHIPEDIRWR